MSTATRSRPKPDYSERPDGTYYGEDRLANFTARITREVVVNELFRLTRYYHVEAVNERGRRSSVQVEDRKFASMNWAYQLGADFIPAVGLARKKRLDFAIRTFSRPAIIGV